MGSSVCVAVIGAYLRTRQGTSGLALSVGAVLAVARHAATQMADPLERMRRGACGLDRRFAFR